MEKKIYKTNVAGQELTAEFFYLAAQANSSVLIRYGQTAVLATVVMSKDDLKSDYMPLKVDYEEKFYAIGKILGSRYFRREGRAPDEAVLAARLIDRTIRPLFDQRIRREIQVVATILAYDEASDPDFAALIGASLALSTSDIPWDGPVGGVRIAKIGEDYIVNPSVKLLTESKPTFQSFVSGPYKKINMIEFSGLDAQEEDVQKAFEVAQKEIDKLIEFQLKITKEIGKEKAKLNLSEVDKDLEKEIINFLADKLEGAVYQKSKADHYGNLEKLKNDLIETLEGKFEDLDLNAVEFLFEEEINKLVHKNILEKEKRPDFRKLDEIRQLSAEIDIFPRTHGSAIFNRGETQALAITTLAAPGAEKIIETMKEDTKQRFMLNYNFPPFSVGEIGSSSKGPGRREIGHGALAEKALAVVIPSLEEFPYVIRVVSEILSSNGSSSMASVCAGTLSLLDAGVPIKKPVAGIAMGLMVDEKTLDSEKPVYKILTDIQGPEDHHGDMDFKVAGTYDGINAIQLDVKFGGLNLEMIKNTLAQAKKARIQILDLMTKVISRPKPISSYAPVIEMLKIDPEQIGKVIGAGGKVINALVEKTGVLSVDIEDDGRVFVSADNREKALEAKKEIELMTREIKIGDIVEGKVVKILDFGAIVDIGGGKDGMIHVSELKNGYVKNVEDVLHVGDFVRAKVINVDLENNKISLSLKQLKT